MKMTVTRSDFVDAFERLRPENFSVIALSHMYDFFEEVDEDMELDVIAICCDYSEYSTAIAAARDYGYEPPEDLNPEDLEDSARDWLFTHTTVIELGGEGYVVAGF